MANNLVSAQDVKSALNINSFRELSKDKVIEFISLIPNMNQELAMECVKQFPAFTTLAKDVIDHLTTMCESVIQSGDSCQKEAIAAYMIVLNSLSDRLKSEEDLSVEDRNWISEKMIEVAQMVGVKDSEHKAWLNNIPNYVWGIAGLALGIAGSLLGTKISSTKLPSLKK